MREFACLFETCFFPRTESVAVTGRTSGLSIGAISLVGHLDGRAYGPKSGRRRRSWWRLKRGRPDKSSRCQGDLRRPSTLSQSRLWDAAVADADANACCNVAERTRGQSRIRTSPAVQARGPNSPLRGALPSPAIAASVDGQRADPASAWEQASVGGDKAPWIGARESEQQENRPREGRGILSETMTCLGPVESNNRNPGVRRRPARSRRCRAGVRRLFARFKANPLRQCGS